MSVMFTRKQLQPFIDDKYISVQKHPEADLYIYNYTQKCQYDQNWTPETLACRGLILDANNNIVARPFSKFFNLSEHKGKLPEGKPKVWEKYDGSLGIMYWIDGTPYIATRGSFTSEQAIKGTELLHENGNANLFEKGVTYLFEIIYPDNRIVVDYGNTEKLVHLATIDNETGQTRPDKMPPAYFTSAASYDIGLNELQHRENREGYVLEWPNGFRLKVKHNEYVRLHRLVTQVTARSIWDLLRNGEPIDELLDNVPDEFFDWVRQTKKDFQVEFEHILRLCMTVFNQVKDLETRKEQAMVLQKFKYKAMVFKMLDGKDIKDLIWKELYPPHITPFKKDI